MCCFLVDRTITFRWSFKTYSFASRAYKNRFLLHLLIKFLHFLIRQSFYQLLSNYSLGISILHNIITTISACFLLIKQYSFIYSSFLFLVKLIMINSCYNIGSRMIILSINSNISTIRLTILLNLTRTRLLFSIHKQSLHKIGFPH